MKRRKPLRRKQPLKRINPERLAELRAKQFNKQADLCRHSPCMVCGTFPSDPAHVRSRGAGGRDKGNVVPLCREHHQRQHQEGWGWILDMGLDPKAVAAVYERLAYGE